MFIGVVGKPSTGKSTFFKAATLAEVEIANYPFTTIKPNHAVGFVKVKDVAVEFGKVSNPREGYCLQGFRFIPVDLMDVAGLVPGAHEGLGMGNQFLDDLRQADALMHIVDASGSVNEKGEPVPIGSYDPLNDVRFLEKELDMWYLGILKKGWERFARQIMQEKTDISKALAKQLSGLRVNEDMVEAVLRELKIPKEKPIEWNEEILFSIAQLLRKKTKPMLIAANKIDIPVAKENIERLKQQFPEYIIIPISAESELALREAAKHQLINYVPGDASFEISNPEKLSEKQKKALEFIKKNIIEKYGSTGVQQVINEAVFSLLQYVAIFPGGVNKLEDSKGNVIPDCFLMPPQTTALSFAFRLHTDFGNKFICAKDVRTKRTIGREHVLKSLDIVEIVSGK
ncbi:redox-regulated ATPase YchF [Candidatus Woesearchaeota archaeon]|nr:redox-regulated ATPase YchF [Candidatus Woesearchaeota archaeon]